MIKIMFTVRSITQPLVYEIEKREGTMGGIKRGVRERKEVGIWNADRSPLRDTSE